MPKAYVAPFMDDDGSIVATVQTERSLPSSLTVPPAIARLPHHNGKPVAYVDPWSGEFPLRVGYDHAVGTWALCHAPGKGVGEPLPKGCNTERARHSIVFGLCRLCGQPIRGGAWMVVEHETQIGPPVTVWEPPACFECLRFSLGVCPFMLRIEDRDGVLYQVHRYVPYARLLCFKQPPESNGQGEELEAECEKRGGVVGAPWAMVTEWSTWTAQEVLDRPTEPPNRHTNKTVAPAMPQPFTAEELDALADEESDTPRYGLHDLRLPGYYVFWREWHGWRWPAAVSSIEPLRVEQGATPAEARLGRLGQLAS